ncbi:MAG: 5-methyltetrahydropteroyltriglutamate--homocysteine S-methyltransferase [Candidatus Binatus sp.]|uniref:5-methyltetrahydropteroyltriglutamate-- homocysteine S-methyltransferase n=1 Tax=Candidatus Binatus sp. TaxID=2811406 RepID=UPI002725A60F|nr:5-methyltetrahydropteroyltriglutamate--homocysteine S-methyltransferase [Candidatus Binatus sp.]MDO8431929.1 5-methyltetrahydropteroyltriglutamate--homocysteine S-methyltransferase [Candidatus Binatus sp.]
MKINPPFRAEHIGSLLRPRELKDAFGARSRGEIDELRFREILERCIVDAIRMQEEVGLETITDGEFRRVAWSTGFVSALEGLGSAQSIFEFRDSAGNSQRWDTCFAKGRVTRPRAITLEEFRFVRQHTNRTPKVTMPAPSFLHFFRLNECADRKVYPELDLFWSDLVRIYREELSELGAAGASYVQFDEVPQAMLCDENVRAKVREHGEDPQRLLGLYIDAMNAILEARPPGMTIGMHLCRGNLRGRWMAQGGYEAIAERLFSDLKVDGFFLEYDSARAGDFSPLRFMPKDKFVRLGLISSKTPVLEHKDELRRRIDEAAKFAALDSLGISPQCGFASTAGGNPLTAEDQKAKLRLVVQIANEVWK